MVTASQLTPNSPMNSQSAILTPKRWRIQPALGRAQLRIMRGAIRDSADMDSVLAQILYNRGFTTAGAARAFLRGELTERYAMQMRDMDIAVDEILTAVEKQRSIVVYGDFDADGVTSTTLLVTALKQLGAHVRAYIPHRVDEGYGLNTDALDRLKADGADLVITVDCGIRSVQEVAHGTRIGLRMIVTDHHSIGPELPDALAVINPKRADCPYPEDMLAGVGVVYKLVEALAVVARYHPRIRRELDTTQFLDLVAIGTVADLVPLDRAENRRLVIDGLKQIRRAMRPGLNALLTVAGTPPDAVDAQSIAFRVAPRINAAGRLESALLAYELLAARNEAAAIVPAQQLNALNEKRQRLTEHAQNIARAGLAMQDEPPALIFASDPGFPQGIVGLVAGRLTEEYYRPSAVLHYDSNGESHGSCRSIAEFDITAALDECADLLLRHGGHAQAAGFAIANENISAFQARLTALAMDGLAGQDLRPTITIDAELHLPELTGTMADILSDLEPCGHGAEAPLLAVRNVRVAERRFIGKDNKHLKLKLTDGTDTRDAVGWSMGNLIEAIPDRVDVAFSLKRDIWNGQTRVQMQIADLRPAER